MKKTTKEFNIYDHIDFTQDEIDAAPLEVQEERARRTFQFAQKIPEDKTFDIFEET